MGRFNNAAHKSIANVAINLPRNLHDMYSCMLAKVKMGRRNGVRAVAAAVYTCGNLCARDPRPLVLTSRVLKAKILPFSFFQRTKGEKVEQPRGMAIE